MGMHSELVDGLGGLLSRQFLEGAGLNTPHVTLLNDKFKSCHYRRQQNFVLPTDIVGVIFVAADIGPSDVVAVIFPSYRYMTIICNNSRTTICCTTNSATLYQD